MRCPWTALLLLAGCSGGPEVAPGGIVSNNPCIDAILAQVAPEEIAAVSSWSHDPDSASAPLDWARARPALGVTAEEIIAAKPRLLLTGNLASSGTNAALAKAGVAQLARNLAVEWGPDNIRVNCIAPGLIRTAFAKALTDDPVKAGMVENETPLRRIGEPDDIGGIAVLLASAAGKYITGQTIVADGGMMIR